MPETLSLDLSKYETDDKDKTPNVKKLWSPEIPESEEELSFDPERDITEEDCEEIKNLVIHLLSKSPQGGFQDWIFDGSEMASNIRIIDPKFELNLTRESWVHMNELLTKKIQEENLAGAIEIAKNMKIIDSKIELDLPENFFSQIESDLKIHQENKNWVSILKTAMGAIIINQNFTFNLTDDSMIGIKKFQKDLINSENEISWKVFMKAMAYTKISIPQLAQELELNKSTRQKILKIWQKYQYRARIMWEPSRLNDLIQIATFMKILAAEKVEVTDQGLKITMPERKPKITTTPPLPAKLELY